MLHNPVFVLETKGGDQAREHGPRSDALISLCDAHAVFTDRSPSEYFMKVLLEISNIVKLVHDCINGMR